MRIEATLLCCRDGTIYSEESCSQPIFEKTMQLWRQLNDADPEAAFFSRPQSGCRDPKFKP